MKSVVVVMPYGTDDVPYGTIGSVFVHCNHIHIAILGDLNEAKGHVPR